MDIVSLRKELGLSQEGFGAKVGLSSKGHVSQLENGKAGCSVDVALAIERISEGRITAHSLNADVALIRANDTPHSAEAA